MPRCPLCGSEVDREPVPDGQPLVVDTPRERVVVRPRRDEESRPGDRVKRRG